MPLGQPTYVSDLIVYILHESLVNYGQNQAPEMITCSHEEVAAAMAEGY